jgi:hypothetical protein
MMKNHFHLSYPSKNIKTGPIAVSTSSAITCPDSCPLKKNGCYADSGPLALHWRKVSNGERGCDFQEFLNKIKELPRGILTRINQSGDLMGENEVINPVELDMLTKAGKKVEMFTYTHKQVLFGRGVPTEIVKNNRAAISAANEAGFTINLSGNNLDHADKLFDLGIAPVVSVVPSDVTRNCVTPKGRRMVVCPATKSDRMNCDKCRLCQKKDRNFGIVFPAHGSRKKRVDLIVNNK